MRSKMEGMPYSFNHADKRIPSTIPSISVSRIFGISLPVGVLQNYWTVKEMVRLVPAVPVADLFVYGVPVRMCPPVDNVPA